MPTTPKDGPPTSEEAKQGLLQYAKAWGENPLPPTVLATLITAQHLRPFQGIPMLFPPVLLFTSYLNVNGMKIDSAGLSGAWSALFLVLARRRRQVFRQKFGARGIVRGATIGLAAANTVGGGLAYFFGRRESEDHN